MRQPMTDGEAGFDPGGVRPVRRTSGREHRVLPEPLLCRRTEAGAPVVVLLQDGAVGRRRIRDVGGGHAGPRCRLPCLRAGPARVRPLRQGGLPRPRSVRAVRATDRRLLSGRRDRARALRGYLVRGSVVLRAAESRAWPAASLTTIGGAGGPSGPSAGSTSSVSCSRVWSTSPRWSSCSRTAGPDTRTTWRDAG